MKKTTFAFLLAALAGLSLNAADSKIQNLQELERFFYNKGYQDAKNRFYEKGFKDGIKFAEEKLKEYRAKIKALEAGKYLIKEQKITYPEVYQITDRYGNVKVVIDGCKIQKPLSPEDILKIPLIPLKACEEAGYIKDPAAVTVVEEHTSKQTAVPSVSNAVFLDDNEDILPKKPSDEVDVYYKYFPNKEFYKRLLDKAGIIYSISGDKIKALFSSYEEARKFCKTYHLKQNVDCF